MKSAAIPIFFFYDASPSSLILVDCPTTKAIITNGKSSRAEHELHFYVDDSAKTIAFSDGTRLRVIRFDNSAISAAHDDMQYEINWVDGTVTYAGSKTVGKTSSGQCKTAANKSGD
jgi:hypothetical protein